MKRFLVVLTLAALMGSAAGLSQVDPSVEQGVHAFGSYDASKVDSVNLQNGAVSLKIPLFSYPERGKFGASVYLVMSSKRWAVDTTCDVFTGSCGGTWEILNNPQAINSKTPYPNLVGVGVVLDDGVPGTGGTTQLVELPNGNYVHKTFPDAIDADGSTHPLMGNIEYGFYTIDGSGIFVPANATSLSLISRNGVSKYDNYDADVEDANGNIEASSTGQDSMGRNGLYAAFSNAQTITDSSGCGGTLPIDDVKLVTFPSPNGSTRLLKLCSVFLGGQTDFRASYYDPGNPGNDAPIAEGSYGGHVLQSAVLCDVGTASCDDSD